MSSEIKLKPQLKPADTRKLARHLLLAAAQPRKLRLRNTYSPPSLALHECRLAIRFRRRNWQRPRIVKSAEPAMGSK